MATPMLKQVVIPLIIMILPIFGTNITALKSIHRAMKKLNQQLNQQDKKQSHEIAQWRPEKRLWLGLGAALMAALGAGLCCAGPLLYLLFGLSAASLGLLSWPTWLQWPLAAIALFFWALVLHRLYFSNRPLCATGIHRYLRLIFWLISCII